MTKPTEPQPTKPQPTKTEVAAQHTGSADVSYGANTNLSPADVSETAAAQVIVEQHQASGAQTSSGSSPQTDESGVAGPASQSAEDGTPVGHSGSERQQPD